MLNPNLIDPEAFAEGKQHLQTVMPLGSLDERVHAHDYLAGQDAEVVLALQGGRDHWQRLFLDVQVKADLQLVCQRCMQNMPFALDETARIVLFADEAALDEAMLADEALEGMVLTKELDVRQLVEDQILMALPYAPRHQNCHNEALSEVNLDQPRPFAVLAGLKKD